MIDDALCANPATRGGASTGHGGNDAGPANGRQTLTADSFRALTQRLKSLSLQPAVLSPVETTLASQSIAADGDAETSAPVSPLPADLPTIDTPAEIIEAPSAASDNGAEEARPAAAEDESLTGDDPDRFIAMLRGTSDRPLADAADEDHVADAPSEPDAPDMPSLADLPAPVFTEEIGEAPPSTAGTLNGKTRSAAPRSEMAASRDDDRFIELLCGAPDDAESKVGDENQVVGEPEDQALPDLPQPGLADESGTTTSAAADDGARDIAPAASDHVVQDDLAVVLLPEASSDDDAAAPDAALDEPQADVEAAQAAGRLDGGEQVNDLDSPSDADALDTIRASILGQLASRASEDNCVASTAGNPAPASLQDMLRQLEGQFGSFDGADEAHSKPASSPADADDWSAGARRLLDRDAADETERSSVFEDGEAVPTTVRLEEPDASVSAADDSPADAEAASLPPDDDLGDIDLSAMLGNLGERFVPDDQTGYAGDAQPAGTAGAAGDIEALEALDAALPIDEASGETARMLLDIMSMPASALQPQERGLAADTLLRLIARMPIKAVMSLAERFCLMEEPPGLIIKQLIGHPNEEVAALVLERCANVTDQDLLELIAQASLSKLRMVARRREVSSALVDALISRGDASVYLTIVRNPGADISYDAFIELCELAKNQPSLQAPLATRSNTPAPVAFELFWFLPSELRRYVLSRFLTDSETLTKILKITLAVDSSAGSEVTERQFPPRARIEELVGLIEEGLTPEASRLMANLSGICEACARRLIADPDGEPLTIVMKAMGATRALFAAAMERCQTSTSAMLRTDRNLDELRNLFDSMSFNKARVLLTYWDWAARKAGPYARRAA